MTPKDAKEAIQFAEELGNETIPVMRISMPDSQLPDLILATTRNMDSALEESFLGENCEWHDLVGERMMIVFEDMPLEDFKNLPEWEG